MSSQPLSSSAPSPPQESQSQQQPQPPPASSQQLDAFAVLMQQAVATSGAVAGKGSGGKKKTMKRKRGGGYSSATAPGSSRRRVSNDGDRGEGRTSRFVLCPSGCGKHVITANINFHLDQCMPTARQQEDEKEIITPQSQQQQQKEEEGSAVEAVTVTQTCEAKNVGDQPDSSSPAAAVSAAIVAIPPTPPEARSSPVVENNEESATTNEPENTTARAEIDAEASSSAAVPLEKSNSESVKSNPYAASKKNVFAKMMERSKVVFATERPPRQQQLHLNEDATVSLFGRSGKGSGDFHGRDGDHRHCRQPITWTSKLLLRNRGVTEPGGPYETGDTSPSRIKERKKRRRPVELIISASYPLACLPREGDQPNTESTAADAETPIRAPRRLVQHHSNLSVPVLKSILQKSMRRRKPLPSVRVAMELADRALGELLRRLPVIVLEDSTLHPSLPFLVWLMIAHSKGFHVPDQLILRLLGIVYEVAACQWSDALPDGVNSETSSAPTLSSIFDDDEPEIPTGFAGSDGDTSGRLVIWSILARADYGGMKGDICMLHQYASLWRRRFREAVPASVASRIASSMTVDTDRSDGMEMSKVSLIPWLELPTRIHSRAHCQSIERVHPLFTQGLRKLSIDDICVEGVDFHCSRIVEHLSSLPAAGICRDMLLLAGNGQHSGEDGNNITLDWFLKHCMWHFSSGVNRRQPLLPEEDAMSCAGNEDDDAPGYEALWKQLMAKEALDFQTNYIRQRLP